MSSEPAMAIITIDRLRQNMVLASDVKDRSGRMLLHAGSPVTEKHVHIFRTWGISEVEITDPAEAEVNESQNTGVVPEQFSPEILERAEAQMRLLFHRTDLRQPFIKGLFNIVLARTARRIQRDE